MRIPQGKRANPLHAFLFLKRMEGLYENGSAVHQRADSSPKGKGGPCTSEHEGARFFPPPGHSPLRAECVNRQALGSTSSTVRSSHKRPLLASVKAQREEQARNGARSTRGEGHARTWKVTPSKAVQAQTMRGDTTASEVILRNYASSLVQLTEQNRGLALGGRIPQAQTATTLCKTMVSCICKTIGKMTLPIILRLARTV